MAFILPQAFSLIKSICLCQEQPLERNTPRCLWVSTSEITWFSIKRGGCKALFSLREERLCFLGIKRDKPSFRPGHIFLKIQIEKFSSGIWRRYIRHESTSMSQLCVWERAIAQARLSLRCPYMRYAPRTHELTRTISQYQSQTYVKKCPHLRIRPPEMQIYHI